MAGCWERSAPSPRGPVSITGPPRRRWLVVYQRYPSLPGAECFQLDSNKECLRGLKSWAQAVSPECSAGLRNTPNYDEARTFLPLWGLPAERPHSLSASQFSTLLCPNMTKQKWCHFGSLKRKKSLFIQVKDYTLNYMMVYTVCHGLTDG